MASEKTGLVASLAKEQQELIVLKDTLHAAALTKIQLNSIDAVPTRASPVQPSTDDSMPVLVSPAAATGEEQAEGEFDGTFDITIEANELEGLFALSPPSGESTSPTMAPMVASGDHGAGDATHVPPMGRVSTECPPPPPPPPVQAPTTELLVVLNALRALLEQSNSVQVELKGQSKLSAMQGDLLRKVCDDSLAKMPNA